VDGIGRASAVSPFDHDAGERADRGLAVRPSCVRGLDLDLGTVTVLVGDNGSGKSTVIEAIAVAAGFNAEGGGRNLRFETFATHSGLHEHLQSRWKSRPRWGWFLRAETFYGMASHIATDTGPHGIASMFPDLHGRSHGQSFLTLIERRFATVGLYVMDEPESALSFHGQLQLLRAIHDGVVAGSQFIVATHSPMLMCAAGATLVEFSDAGISRPGLRRPGGRSALVGVPRRTRPHARRVVRRRRLAVGYEDQTAGGTPVPMPAVTRTCSTSTI